MSRLKQQLRDQVKRWKEGAKIIERGFVTSNSYEYWDGWLKAKRDAIKELEETLELCEVPELEEESD